MAETEDITEASPAQHTWEASASDIISDHIETPRISGSSMHQRRPLSSAVSIDVGIDCRSDDFDAEQDAIGPLVRIHRYEIGMKTALWIGLIWLLGGFSFLLVVSLCICVNVGYMTFKSDGAMLPRAVAFIFYGSLVWRLLLSFLRTTLRIGIQWWHSDIASPKEDIVVLRWIDNVAAYVLKTNCENQDQMERHKLKDFDFAINIAKDIILLILIAAVFGIPLILVALKFGYWTVVSFLCVFVVLSACAFILILNLYGRLRRFAKFIVLVYQKLSNDKISPRLRAAYLASTGNDSNTNIIDNLCTNAMQVAIMIFAWSFIFGTYHFNTTAITISSLLFVTFFLLRFRRTLSCYVENVRHASVDLPEMRSTPFVTSGDLGVNRRISTSQRAFRAISQLESEAYHTGQTPYPVTLTFLIRTVCFGAGFGALLYLDITQKRSLDGKPPPKDYDYRSLPVVNSFLMTSAFYLLTLLKDLSFVVPLQFPKLRIFWISFFQISQLAIAIAGKVLYPGYTFIAAVMFSIYGFDYREARHYWTRRHVSIKNDHLRKRATRNLCVIGFCLVLFILASIVIGLIVGSLNTRDPITPRRRNEPQDDDILQSLFSNFQNQNESATPVHPAFEPPICSLRFTSLDLNVMDMATFSQAAYKSSIQEAISFVHANKRLTEWEAGWYDFRSRRPDDNMPVNRSLSNMNNSADVHFVEFIHKKSQVSVIAIRGTHSIEDVFQDLFLWSTPAFLQMSSFFGTLIGLWPTDTVAKVAYIINNVASVPNIMYWYPAEQLIQNITIRKYGVERSFLQNLFSNKNRGNVKDAPVYLTGHSLGGGLANIIGAHLNIPSIAFSAPGLGYSIFNYNLTFASLMRNTLNIMPLNDPVVKFDKQIGMQQNIPCDAGQPVACHSLTRTLQTLIEMCGVSP